MEAKTGKRNVGRQKWKTGESPAAGTGKFDGWKGGDDRLKVAKGSGVGAMVATVTKGGSGSAAGPNGGRGRVAQGCRRGLGPVSFGRLSPRKMSLNALLSGSFKDEDVTNKSRNK